MQIHRSCGIPVGHIALVVFLAVALSCGPGGNEAPEPAALRTTHQFLSNLGGPVILGGDDLTDHGSYSGGLPRNGWLYIQKAQESLKAKVTRPHDGTVAVLGSADTMATSTDAGGAYHYTTPLAGLTPQFYNGAAAIDDFFDDLAAGVRKPAILVIVGTDADNDLDTFEGNTLKSRAVEIANFVNSGGGLLAHGYGPDVAYGWLFALLPKIQERDGCDDRTLSLTPEGRLAFPGLTDPHIRAGPCHSNFTGDLGGLQVLARDGNGRNIIIGGEAVQLPGNISLSPQTVTYTVGITLSHTVEATARDGRLQPVAGATVTFQVSSGPNAGRTGTAVTNAQGRASFTYPSNGTTGTDQIGASFVDPTGILQTAPPVVAIWVAPPNSPPTANAGGPYSTPEGSAVALSGSASDPDGDALSFAWDLDNDGSFDDATGPSASFFGVDGPSTHPVALKVCDSHNPCVTSTTTVQVVNVAPVVNAGADQTVFRNDPVALSGSWTDPAGSADNAYSWAWDLDGNGTFETSGSASFGALVTRSTSFLAAGTYSLTFRVTDKDGASHTDSVTITIVNRPPVADAGGPYATPEGSTVLLSGSGSDPEGDALTFAWDLDSDGSFDDASGASASFFGVDGLNTHQVALKVCDSQGACSTSTAVVQVSNVAPVVNAGTDQTVFRNTPVSLSGSWTDPAGSADNAYSWAWDLDGDGTLETSGTASFGTTVTLSTSFLAAGTYTLTFRVTDKDGASHSDSVTITIVNRPPEANAGGPYVTLEGSTVILSGSGSDPDGDVLTFAWDLDNDGSYDDAFGASASFFGVDGPSTHSVGLQVCDPAGACATSSTTVQVINVAPVVNAGADQTVFRNAPVSLSGSWTDPAGSADNAYSWAWDLDGDGTFETSGAASFGTLITQSTSFAADGTYSLTFRVTDKDGASHSDSVTITVINRPPDCSTAAPSVSSLWPPNHQMVPVSVLGVTDPEGDSLTLTITSIRQDEPVNSIADGNTDVDGTGVGTSTAVVRAERSGSKHNPGNGRVYHIGFSADDGNGGFCSGIVRVGVPHDQGGQSQPVDNGPLYDSTTP
jgi:methionine-rich copper-binding protein CopC